MSHYCKSFVTLSCHQHPSDTAVGLHHHHQVAAALTVIPHHYAVENSRRQRFFFHTAVINTSHHTRVTLKTLPQRHLHLVEAKPGFLHRHTVYIKAVFNERLHQFTLRSIPPALVSVPTVLTSWSSVQ